MTHFKIHIHVINSKHRHRGSNSLPSFETTEGGRPRSNDNGVGGLSYGGNDGKLLTDDRPETSSIFSNKNELSCSIFFNIKHADLRQESQCVQCIYNTFPNSALRYCD